MTLLGLVVLFVIAAAVGALGQSLAGYSLGGCPVSGIAGLVGAVIGNWLARTLGLPEPLTITIQGEHFALIWSIIGVRDTGGDHWRVHQKAPPADSLRHLVAAPACRAARSITRQAEGTVTSVASVSHHNKPQGANTTWTKRQLLPLRR